MILLNLQFGNLSRRIVNCTHPEAENRGKGCTCFSGRGGSTDQQAQTQKVEAPYKHVLKIVSSVPDPSEETT